MASTAEEAAVEAAVAAAAAAGGEAGGDETALGATTQQVEEGGQLRASISRKGGYS